MYRGINCHTIHSVNQFPFSARWPSLATVRFTPSRNRPKKSSRVFTRVKNDTEGTILIRLRGCRVRVSMAPSRKSERRVPGQTVSSARRRPPTTRAPRPNNEGDPRAFSMHRRNTNVVAPPSASVRSNAMTRAPPPAGLYDARSNYRRHTFRYGKHGSRDAIVAAGHANDADSSLILSFIVFSARPPRARHTTATMPITGIEINDERSLPARARTRERPILIILHMSHSWKNSVKHVL